MAATIAIVENVSQMGIVYIFEESEVFFTISVGMKCRDESNAILFTEEQVYQLLRLVVMIWFKIVDFIQFPQQILVYFTDCSLIYRL